MSRPPFLRNGSWSHSERLPNRWLGCAWAGFALPCQTVDRGSPARLGRSLLPVQAAEASPPRPRGPDFPTRPSQAWYAR